MQQSHRTVGLEKPGQSYGDEHTLLVALSQMPFGKGN